MFIAWFKKIDLILISILSFVILFLIGHNKRLLKKNDDLHAADKNSNKVIDVQNKIIEVVENHKSVNIDGVVDLMRKNKL